MLSPNDKREIARYYREKAHELEVLVKDKNPQNSDGVMDLVKRLRKEANELDPPENPIAEQQWNTLKEALKFDGSEEEFEKGLENMKKAQGARPKAQGRQHA